MGAKHKLHVDLLKENIHPCMGTVELGTKEKSSIDKVESQGAISKPDHGKALRPITSLNGQEDGPDMRKEVGSSFTAQSDKKQGEESVKVPVIMVSCDTASVQGEIKLSELPTQSMS